MYTGLSKFFKKMTNEVLVFNAKKSCIQQKSLRANIMVNIKYQYLVVLTLTCKVNNENFSFTCYQIHKELLYAHRQRGESVLQTDSMHPIANMTLAMIAIVAAEN